MTQFSLGARTEITPFVIAAALGISSFEQVNEFTMTMSPTWNPTLYAEKYSFVWKMAEDLLGVLNPKAGERILDLGCGTGQMTARIAASGALVTGIDSSAEMIHQARENFPSLRFEVMDAREARFPKPFDAVFSNAALHWIPQPERVVASMRGVLRRGGRFVAEFGGRGNVASLMAAVNQAQAALGLGNAAGSPWYFPGIAEYSQLLESHGLEVTFATLFSRPTPLEGGKKGLREWLRMFGSPFLSKIPAEKRELFLQEVERFAGTALFHDGQWVLDYRRLRFLAVSL